MARFARGLVLASLAIALRAPQIVGAPLSVGAKQMIAKNPAQAVYLKRVNAEAVKLAPGTAPHAVEPGSYLVKITGDRPVRQVNGDVLRWKLPAVFVGPNAENTKSSSLQINIQCSLSELRFNLVKHRFEGGFSVGLEDLEDPAAHPVATPIGVQVVNSNADSVEPSMMKLDHTGVPYEPVSVASNESRDSVKIVLHSELDNRDLPVKIPFRLQPLRLILSRLKAAGFGIDTVTVQVLGPSGAQVALSAAKGALDRSTVKLEEGIATATLRTRSWGTDRITATADGVDPGSVDLNLFFPMSLLLWVLVGSVIGSGGSALWNRKDKSSLFIPFAVGSIAGLILAALAVAGLQFLAIPMGTEIGGFATAAAGGVLGFGFLSKKLGGES